MYVGGLHGSQLEGGPRAAQEALSAELGKWGAVAKVTLKLFAKNTTGYGFVAFSSQKDAEAAVSAYVAGEYVPFDDPKIVLNFGKAPGGSVAEEEEEEEDEEDDDEEEEEPKKPALRAPSSSVYVGGLHGSQLDGAKEALAVELGKWGEVAKVTLKRFKNSGYGFVAFSSQKDAEAAVSAYVAGEYVPFDDPKIVLNFGKAPGGSVAEEEEKGAEKPARRLVSASAAKREAAAAAAAEEEAAAAAATAAPERRDNPPSSSVYITSILPGASAEELKRVLAKEFSRFGEIDSLRVLEPKKHRNHAGESETHRCAFVNFGSVAAAEAAVAELGQRYELTFARPTSKLPKPDAKVAAPSPAADDAPAAAAPPPEPPQPPRDEPRGPPPRYDEYDRRGPSAR